jgi:lysophospholipase L1-like esterase
MKSAFSFLAILAFAVFANFAASPFEKWEPEIQKFEAQDKLQTPPKGATLFVGSSSIRLWTNITAAFPKRTVIARGFGGSTMADAAHFVDRIVLPYQPKQIFVYEGDNDLAAGKAPETVAADFKAFYEKVHKELPKTKVWFISIKPSPSRWNLEKKALEANALIKKFTKGKRTLGYIDVWNPMLGTDGKPRPELFGPDNLHMNATGYELWKKIIGPKL